ncbi:hypothetical protein PQZ40_02895 [Alphaproteobacteria bacterium]|nr:hypothetical protein [Alphaproteobacteria bacterium]
MYFVNNIALAYLCVGIIGLLNYYFGLVDINFLRSEAGSYAHAYARGAITPNQELIGYKGSFSNTHWFAIDRFIWMSLSACFLWYANRTKDHSINKHVLMVSIAIGSCEIILSQARVLSLVSVILFLYSLYAYKKIYIVYLTGFLLIVSPLIKDYAFFYYTNIYSLAGILFEDMSGFSYNLGTDKRYQAIIGILENFEQIIFAPLGPLFWNFSPLVLGTQSEYFDDLYPMINIIPEYGLFPLVFFLLLIARALKFSRGLFYRPLFFWLLLTLLASVANYMPKFYFYAFFAIGALIGARSIFHKQLDSQF